ncbi:hypothetical protein B0T25DRAFT_300871 [Lasiosphaeria hispida]|uniref:Uncharacterized protein n=1 Tax=Lasiosphaeria hispida TaxID=260671 RepID=A0AAJ0M9E9_9PEZI|nr:hypothetical protein B0T25DRAFT_300871 [Lasiosphaeria hispida]
MVGLLSTGGCRRGLKCNGCRVVLLGLLGELGKYEEGKIRKRCKRPNTQSPRGSQIVPSMLDGHCSRQHSVQVFKELASKLGVGREKGHVGITVCLPWVLKHHTILCQNPESNIPRYLRSTRASRSSYAPRVSPAPPLGMRHTQRGKGPTRGSLSSRRPRDNSSFGAVASKLFRVSRAIALRISWNCCWCVPMRHSALDLFFSSATPS